MRVEIADIFASMALTTAGARRADAAKPSEGRGGIERCRTAALGGQLYSCEHCGGLPSQLPLVWDRHCPKCQNDQAEAWLGKQEEGLLLPVPHFMITLPSLRSSERCPLSPEDPLQPIVSACQRPYRSWPHVPGSLAAGVGMVGVLCSPSNFRDLHYHPHVHYLSLPAADSRPMAPGCPHVQTSWSTSSRCRYLFRAKVERNCKRRPLPGERTGIEQGSRSCTVSFSSVVAR